MRKGGSTQHEKGLKILKQRHNSLLKKLNNKTQPKKITFFFEKFHDPSTTP
jgi:hypothetical protein